MAWWKYLYEEQHEIWPNWSNSESEANLKVNFLINWLKLNGKEYILDLGCGVGKELIAFGKKNFRGIGLDISEKLLEKAKRKAISHNVQDLIKFKKGDFRFLNLNKKFNVIVFLDSTLNIFSYKQMKKILTKCFNLLDQNGTLIIEQLNLEYWSKNERSYTIKSNKIGPGKTIRTYKFDHKTSCLIDKVYYYTAEENEGKFLPTQKLRLLNQNEIIMLLTSVGFVDINTIGSHGSVWKMPPKQNIYKKSMSLMSLGKKSDQ